MPRRRAPRRPARPTAPAARQAPGRDTAWCARSGRRTGGTSTTTKTTRARQVAARPGSRGSSTAGAAGKSDRRTRGLHSPQDVWSRRWWWWPFPRGRPLRLDDLSQGALSAPVLTAPADLATRTDRLTVRRTVGPRLVGARGGLCLSRPARRALLDLGRGRE